MSTFNVLVMSCFARVLDPQGFIGSGSREHNARCLGSASSVCEIASKVPAQEEVAEGSDARQLLLQLASSMPTSLTSPVSRPPPAPLIPRYPSNGVEYGQSMLCLSLTGATIDTLASSFRLTRPQVRVRS